MRRISLVKQRQLKCNYSSWKKGSYIKNEMQWNDNSTYRQNIQFEYVTWRPSLNSGNTRQIFY